MQWIDRKRHVIKNDNDVVSDLNSTYKVNKYIKSQNPYDMLIELLAIFTSGSEAYLLDADFSVSELNALGINKNEQLEQVDVTGKPTFDNTIEIAEALKNKDWKIWLYTSGTTGLPKKVCHNFATLGRNVRCSQRHASDIWAFAYKMSHMAGIQVLLQALTNNNRIVYVFEDDPQDILRILNTEKCSHISATPTFYRNLLPFISDNDLDLQHITLGGEKYDENLCSSLKSLLPGAKIHNIYASTETGSIFSSHGDTFSIPEKYKSLIRINSQNELCIHKSLLGEFPCESMWYNTHDLVEVNDSGIIKFISRKSDLINVGGYKVNPLEVESVILQVPGVEDCLVKGEKNSVVGTLLVVDIVTYPHMDDKVVKREIIKKLKSTLQSFKVPRLFHFVGHIEKTRSGKKVRK